MFSTHNSTPTSPSDSNNTMFTTHNPALVPHFDGVMTRFSASTDHTNLDFQSDLIAFLSIVQRCNVDYLAISWQPSLGTLGSGGSSTITQSTFILDMPLAFKRFHDDGDSGMDFRPLISEVLILSQPPIQSHPNIINLEGICWEIKPNIEKAYPVLIFEKAPWDLHVEIVKLEKLDCILKYRYIHGLIYAVVGVCLCMSCTHACALSWHLQLSGISS